jgi:hypothetical protein
MHAGHAQDAVGLRHAKVAARMIELALATRMEVQKYILTNTLASKLSATKRLQSTKTLASQ